MTSVLFEPHADDAVLFACYTLLREKPYVVTVLGADKERQWETRQALHFLSLAGAQWDQTEEKPDWVSIEAAMRLVSTDAHLDHVWFPLPEDRGHEQHNIVGEIGRGVFGDRARFYATYRRGFTRSRTDNEVEPEADWPAAKFKAMSFYISQINHPQRQPWFAADDALREWVA